MVRGMTLIDVVVGSGIILLVFVSLFSAFTLAVELASTTKARAGAVSVVADSLERLRAMPYDELGTLGGIPAGMVPQVATTSLNGVFYTVRTLIQYVDDPADGTGTGDTNGVSADYKRVKVEVTWLARGRTESTSAVTLAAPRGVETLAGGGTLRIVVFDALARPVPGARVSITNASLMPPVAVNVTADDSGTVLFPGSPQSTGYAISVTKDGYSSAGTYDVSTGNPSPNPGRLSVVPTQTTTASFAIDRLGTLALRTVSPEEVQTFEDSFTSLSFLAATSSVSISDGALRLAGTAGQYALVGEARSILIAPTALARWSRVEFSASALPGESLRVRLLVPNGEGFLPLPDSVLPGNGAGFTTGPIDMSGVSTSTYPRLALSAVLTGEAVSTPALTDWRLIYVAGRAPLPNTLVSLVGAKSIGATLLGTPVPKTLRSVTTDAAGAFTDTVEWDAYTVTPPEAFDLFEVCPFPVVVQPGERTDTTLTLVPRSPHSLRVLVTHAGLPVRDATVSIGALPPVMTGDCGQAYIPQLSADRYTLTVSKVGYTPATQTVSVSGRTETTVLITN